MNFCKKKEIDWVTLPQPDDSLSFFEAIKKESEIYWVDTAPDDKVYGFGIQQGSKWKQGLTEDEIIAFESALGFSFPLPLRNFYSTMNGLTKPGINIYGSSGTPPTFRSVFYSLPDDLPLIQGLIDWIYEATSIKPVDIEQLGISKIFPVFAHKCMLLNIPENPILSMHGDDIIYYADNLSKLLANIIFDDIYNVYDFESSLYPKSEVRFWLDDKRSITALRSLRTS